MRYLAGFLIVVSLILFSPEARGQEVAEKKAVFAGGCFWCMEPPFEKLEGVSAVISGYAGGDQKNPSYREVSAGLTNHLEAIEVTYDPEKVSYDKLLETFWMSVDPTQDDGQFADRGHQYKTAIFYKNETELEKAEKSKQSLAASGRFSKPIVTPIVPFKNFYAAEEYHQDYYKKNPTHYKMYRRGSGREGFLESVWGDDLA